MERQPGFGAVMTVMLVVVGLAAMAEIVAGRSVGVVPERAAATPPPPAWTLTARAGDEARARGDAVAARRAYLTTLFRARDAHALAGVLAAAEGFEALGDEAVVVQALRVADHLARAERDAATLARLRALHARVADASPAAASR
jgi:hypothetical protein